MKLTNIRAAKTVARIYHERGTTRYTALVVGVDGKCHNQRFKSRADALEYIQGHKQQMTIEEVEV